MKKLGFIGTGNMGGALILAAAKSQYDTFGTVLEKAKKKIDEEKESI